jgi:aspartyl-tRNA(Asn)/glutamyl-tRNA(Gln) amidotransferase subunit A
MDYSIPVREFMQCARTGDIDLDDFYASLFRKLKVLDGKYGLFVTLAEEQALQRVASIRGSAVSKQGTLFGLPVPVKDCIVTKGIQSSAGSRVLEGYVPVFQSTSVGRAEGQGGVVVGKTAQDEFGFGTFSTNSGYRIPLNPLDPERSCGGSSGGSAGLARALDMPHISLAESTGGSISCPASFCGVVGLTPTYGLVSRYGLIDYASSLDKIGCIGKSVEDAALMLSAIAGHDPMEATSLPGAAPDYVKGLSPGLKGLKVGIPREYFEGADKGVADAVWGSLKRMESAGAVLSEVSLPMTRYAVPAYYIIACAEASTNLARYCGMRYGASGPLSGDFNQSFSEVRSTCLGEEAKRRILLGTYARMAGYRDEFYLRAMKARTLIIRDFQKALKGMDVLAAPAMPCIAPRFSEIKKLTPVQNYTMDVLTVGPNLAGIPHISVPCGSVQGMPVGLHLMAGHLQEQRLLSAAAGFEEIHDKNQ